MKSFFKVQFVLLIITVFFSCQSDTKEVINVEEEVKRKEYLSNEEFNVFTDRVVQGTDKEAWVISPTEIKSTYYNRERTWTLREDVSAMPKVSAPGFPLLEALYNMSLEETKRDILKDKNAFMAGKKWEGVWTRDISYSIHLALAMVEPEVSMNSLKYKVNEQELVIQDTGTGGSWPVSTDRVVWALASWELYKVTGDREWLSYSYNVLRNTALRDNTTAYDAETGLFNGESSFMDWRDQSYGKWMGPVDIYESKALSTNVAHFSTRKILAQMAVALGLDQSEIDDWESEAENIKNSINEELWVEDKNYYSAYMYPEIMGAPLTPMTDSLGEALAVIEGVSDNERGIKLISNLPVVPFGTPSLYPQLRGVRPYHNKGIWPFVTAYYTWAGAKTRNMEAVDFGIKSLTRASALFLSNYENMVYDNGHNRGTEINSERQLWSVAGYLSVVYRDLFGMDWTEGGLTFNPMVPSWIKEGLILSNFKFRDALLTIELIGSGDTIDEITLDGTLLEDRIIPYDLTGDHKVSITLSDSGTVDTINIQKPGEQGAKTPQIKIKEEENRRIITWKKVSGGVKFGIYKDGEEILQTTSQEYIIDETIDTTSAYSVVAYSEDGIPSPFSNYLLVTNDDYIFKPVDSGRYNSDRKIENPRINRTFDNFIEIIKGEDDIVELDLDIKSSGNYFIQFEYRNDNGHYSTDNKCAIRSAEIDGSFIGKFIFPQRAGMAKKLGYSNSIKVYLEEGRRVLKLYYSPADDNMNIEINQAQLATINLFKMD